MDLISRQALQKAMYERAFETDGDTMWQSGCWVRYRAVEGVIQSQPSIERKKGRWVVVSDGYGYGEATACICECSECKDTIWVYKKADRKWKFCPSCGADMRERKES